MKFIGKSKLIMCSKRKINQDKYKETTYQYLCNKFNDFHKVNLEAENTLLCGKPQAGKSAFTFAVAIMNLLAGKTSIFIVRNFTQDYEHLAEKFLRFSQEHQLFMKKNFPEETKTINTVYAGDMSFKKIGKDKLGNPIHKLCNSDKIKKALEKNSMNIIIALANGTQLAGLNILLDEMPELNNIVIYTDEADSIGYSEIKDPAPLRHRPDEYNTLLKRCSQSYEISATVWDVLYGNKNLLSTNIIVITPPPTYKGIRNGVQFIQLDYPIENWKKGMDLLSEDANFYAIYHDLLTIPTYKKNRYNNTLEHPVIILHKTRTEIAHHQAFYNFFQEDFTFKKYWTIIMEGDEGIYLYSNSIKIIKIKQFVFRENKGNFFFGKKIIIPQLLQWFIDNGGAIKFSHIVIKSGHFSGRSRSYVSTDGNWHLTHQYYKGGSDIPTMIQAQRLLHDRPDSIPLIEFAPKNIIKALQKGDILQDEQIERLKFGIEIPTHIKLSEEEWTKEKVPAARLCTGTLNRKFKVKKVNKNDGGWNKNIYTEPMTKVELAQQYIGNIEEDIEEDIEKDIGSNLEKYIIIDMSKISKNSKCWEMLEDIHKILIEETKLNQNIPIDWINKKLQTLNKYNNLSLDNIRGNLWTNIRNNKKLLKTNKKLPNELLYWKENNDVFISLTN